MKKWARGSTKEELEEKLDEIRFKYNVQTKQQTSNVRFEDVAELWFKIKKSNKSLATRRHARDWLDNHIYPTFANFPITNIKAYQVEELVNEKIAQGYTDTAKRVLSTIKSIFKFAISNDYVTKDITVGIEAPRVTSEIRQPLTEYEREVVEAVAPTHSFGLAILTMLHTGMRREEMIALKKSDIDFKNKVIHIRRGMYFDSNTPYEKSTKNGKERSVPLLDVLIQPLREKYISTKGAYIFSKNDGNMLTQSAYRRAFDSFIYACNVYAKSINGEHICFTAHQLRHTYATTLYYAGVSIKKSQELLGHSSAQMTIDLYTHLDNEREKDTANILNNYLTSKSLNDNVEVVKT